MACGSVSEVTAGTSRICFFTTGFFVGRGVLAAGGSGLLQPDITDKSIIKHTDILYFIDILSRAYFLTGITQLDAFFI